MSIFKPAKMPSAAAPALSNTVIQRFLGADLTNAPGNVDEERSPDCENMVRDVPGKVRKRTGWKTQHQYHYSRVYGYHTLYGQEPLYHVGKILYRGEDQIYTGANEFRSKSWEFGNKSYIADGLALLVYDGGTVQRVDRNAYIPTKTIAKAPAGGGTPYEALNLLQPKFKEMFLGTADATAYQMTYAPLDSTVVVAEVLQPDGIWKELKENTDFTVNRETGTVTFVSPPGESPVSGEDNVRITAARTIAGYADRINKCRIGIQYGVNGAPDRLFLSGNGEKINYDWYSGLNDPTYWADTAYSVLGQSDSAIVGYSIVANRLATHKDNAETDRNIIIRDGELLDGKPTFRVVNTLQGEGAIAPYSFGYLCTEPLFLTKLGIYAVAAQDITGEKYAQKRSFYLDGKLLDEPALRGAYAVVWRDMYILATGGKLYILDGLQPSSTTRGAPYSTRQYAGFYCTNVPAYTLWVEDDALWFGTLDGRICKFEEDTTKLSAYTDDKEPVYACWRTPDFHGKNFYRNKTFSRLYIELSSAVSTGASIWGKVRGRWEELWNDFATARYFSYSHLTYSKFTYSCDNSPKTIGEKIRIKKVDKAGFRIENGNAEPFGLNAIGIEFVETGYYK